jgi:hypothetical protein
MITYNKNFRGLGVLSIHCNYCVFPAECCSVFPAESLCVFLTQAYFCQKATVLCVSISNIIYLCLYLVLLFKDWSLTDQEMKKKTKKSFLQLYLSLHNFSIILYICLIPLDCIVCVINFYTIFYYSPKVAYPWRIYTAKMSRIHEIEISHLGTFKYFLGNKLVNL